METLNGFSDTTDSLILLQIQLTKLLRENTKQWDKIIDTAQKMMIHIHKVITLAHEEQQYDKEATITIKGGREALKMALNSIYQIDHQDTRQAFRELIDKLPC